MVPEGCSACKAEVRERPVEALGTCYLIPLAAGSTQQRHGHRLSSKELGQEQVKPTGISEAKPAAGKLQHELQNRLWLRT